MQNNLGRSNTLKSMKRMGSVGLKRAGTELKRAGTGLKRAGTGLKRAGTGAWKWINADDVNLNENQPIGHSFFQRSDTFKRMNSAAAAGSSSSSIKRFVSRRKNQKDLEEGKASTSQPQIASPLNRDISRPEEIRPATRTPPMMNNKEEVLNVIPIQQYNNETSRKGTYEYYDENGQLHTEQYRERPKKELTDEEKEKEERRKSKIPKALFDPEVRKQLENLKQHKPYFMYTVTILQIVMMLLSFIINYKYSGKIMENINSNVMIGPSAGTLIHLGARFVPCMKQLDDERAQLYNVTICADGIEGSIPPPEGLTYNGEIVTENLCSLSDLCGMGGFEPGEEPNQWTRFILPIFLHAGIIHIFVNLIFQVRTGIQMERDFGTWRIMIIYMASGIFGFAFGADISYSTPSVGCSGALYGLLGCLLLDLLQNWNLIVNPWSELIKMLFVIIFSLGVGLLPFIDNYAHVGGFITGIFTGLIFMPTIIFGKWDLRRKRFLMVISVPIVIGMFIWVFTSFYSEGQSTCNWCKYVSCIPINDWCDSSIQTTSN